MVQNVKEIDLCALKYLTAPSDKRTDGYRVLINKCVKVVLINKLLYSLDLGR